MKSVRGIEYDLIDALRRNPTIIKAGDDICGKAADEIERLRSELARVASEQCGSCRALDDFRVNCYRQQES